MNNSNIKSVSSGSKPFFKVKFLVFGLILSVFLFLFWAGLVVLFFGGISNLPAKDDRTNILILGIGGAGHQGPELTDTIIFASLSENSKRPILISVPRDIWIESLSAKINSVYFYGNQKLPNSGLNLAKSVISQILGQPVHYAVLVDFGGFVKTVDLIGGIDIDVERTFDDFKYPLAGRENDDCGGKDPQFLCRYEHIHFEKGRQWMNGETALKFVRSRNAEGYEGTDFARSRRQEKVISAIEQKLFSPDFFLNYQKVEKLIEIFNSSFITDIPKENFLALFRLVINQRNKEIRSEVLEGGVPEVKDGLLEHPPISPKYNNEWVLLPAGGTWENIKEWVACVLKDLECPTSDFKSGKS